jgi:hypothetical protein
VKADAGIGDATVTGIATGSNSPSPQALRPRRKVSSLPTQKLPPWKPAQAKRALKGHGPMLAIVADAVGVAGAVVDAVFRSRSTPYREPTWLPRAKNPKRRRRSRPPSSR